MITQSDTDQAEDRLLDPLEGGPAQSLRPAG